MSERYPFRSGWCETDQHHRCAGAYAGVTCTCGCHREPSPPDPDPPAETPTLF